MAIAYVNIRDSKVIEVWLPDGDGKFHPDLPAGEFPETPASMNIRAIEDGETIPEVGATISGEGYVDPPGPALADVKSQAKSKVDTHAEALRLLLLTPGEGQAQAYQLKVEELAGYDAVIAASGTPVETDYPVCSAEIGATGETLADVMDLIRTNRAAWIAWGASIEGPRLKAKMDIAAAANVDAVKAVLDNINWPSWGE